MVLQSRLQSCAMNTTTRLLYSLIVVLVSGFIESGSTIGEQPFVDECIQLDDNAPCPLNSSLLSFYLFTRETQDEPFILNLDNIRDAPFKSHIPLKVLVHGYTGWKDYAPNEELRPAYFEYGDYNILSLDWGPLANESCYLEATYNVKPVGVCAAQLLEEIVAQRDDIPPENIHVIGFSLGAHASGNIGRSLKTFTLERLTVLDPAFPFFDDIFNSKYSVNKNDSLFVDAIHTNAGMKGKINAVGHVDFYMNNAAVQPGCSSSDTSCSHHRAVEYFAETISTQVGFWGYPCTSFWYYLIGVCTPPPTDHWVLMGEHIKRTERGTYFVQTNDKPPFAIGKNVIELDSRALAEQSSYYGIEYLNDNTVGLPGMSDDVQN